MLNLKISTLGLIVSISLGIATLLIAVSSVVTVRGVEDIGKSWESFENGPAKKIEYLQQLSESIGYGGIAHEFKNYVLRGDRVRIVTVQTRVRTATVALTAYRAIGTDATEETALNTIGQTISVYADALETAEKLMSEGLSAGEIDMKISIDDESARNAISALREELALIHLARSEEVNGALSWLTKFSIMSAVAIGAMLLSVLGFMVWFTSLRLGRPIKAMNKAMWDLSHGNLEIEIPALDRTDEIGDMANSVQIFKENAVKVSLLNIEEQARSVRATGRADAMNGLMGSLSTVVDAALIGDFTKRMDTHFDDDDLQGVAKNVNDLVDTVERGLSETGAVLSALADTDLTPRVEGHFQGAFAKLKNDTNAMADRLTDIVIQLRNTSNGVKAATGELLSGANDLSERTGKQAATIQETSAAMEQLAATVMANARKADEASLKSREVAKTAKEGGDVVGRANDAMERITGSSAKISNIIGMIDDIAFQTNLLALNASVEAARAGASGKGFAVVANEVRRLAQSAAEASAEVKELVDQSAIEVSDGSKLVTEAAEKLTEMIVNILANSSLIEGIASDSREQATSIEEVNSAVRLMDEMTQHNAALVEQTNASIEQTETQANELDGIVEVFKIIEHFKQQDEVAIAS